MTLFGGHAGGVSENMLARSFFDIFDLSVEFSWLETGDRSQGWLDLGGKHQLLLVALYVDLSSWQ